MKNFPYDKYKPYLTDYVNSITTKSPNNKSNYICPLCHSGEGPHGTGAFSLKDPFTWHCFKCGKGGDIFDLYQLFNKCDEETAKKGIIELYDNETLSEFPPMETKEMKKSEWSLKTQEEKEHQIDKWNMNILTGLDDGKGRAYFIGRGFSDQAIKKFNLGFTHDKYNNDVVIIPENNYSYVERHINDSFKRQEGETGLFICAGNESDVLFLCEGWADALSLWELGYNAISVNSTNNYRKAIPYAKEQTKYKAFVIAFDNDEPGIKASGQLLNELKKEGLNCIKFDYKQMKQEFNDINDSFTGNKEELERACSEMIIQAHNSASKEKEEIKAKFEGLTSSHYLTNKFDNERKEYQKQRVSTGYSQLDKQMGGGLYKGLYIVGAVSSLGKTTFILNLAIEIAKQNKHVLFFSLEMDEMEMNAKTIARTVAATKTTREAREESISASDIMSATYKGDQEREEVRKAIDTISNGIGNYLHFIPCNFDMNIKTIQKNIDDFIRAYDVAPIVVIDYLQIIPPARINASDKQNIDEITRNLKIIQSKYNMIMFVISSFNRESYLLPCDRTSFKESGTLEYSANVMWGLQLQAITKYEYKKLDETKQKVKKRTIINKALDESPRKLKLVCLKNRFGKSYFETDLIYYKNCDYFPADANDHQQEGTTEEWEDE